MEWFRIFASRFCGFFRKRKAEGDLDVELRSQLEMLSEETIRRGMTPEEAHSAAWREFGGVERAKQLHREQRGLPLLDSFMQDVRFAVRTLAKRPGLSLAAVFTLAIGVGANTAIFTAVHSVLLESLPFPKADRLAIVWSILGTEGRAPASGAE